jgi:hypothetical protein
VSKLRTQTICIILVMLYEGAEQSLCQLQNCAAFEAVPARSMLICVSEFLVVRQLSSSFSPRRRGELGKHRFVTRLLLRLPWTLRQ